jgi:DNA-binding transcriptional LysR family regulator
VGLHLLPGIVQSFRHRYPEVHLELAAQTSSQQLDALRRGQADLGIVVSPSDRSAHDEFEFELLFRAGICAALPAGHRLAKRRRMALSELANEGFVMLSAVQSPAFMGSIYAACSRAGFLPRVVQEASPIQAVLAMVACGVGVSLVPDAVRATGHETVAFVGLSDRPRLDYHLSAVWLRERETPLLRAFVRAAKGKALASPS